MRFFYLRQPSHLWRLFAVYGRNKSLQPGHISYGSDILAPILPSHQRQIGLVVEHVCVVPYDIRGACHVYYCDMADLFDSFEPPCLAWGCCDGSTFNVQVVLDGRLVTTVP
jgi:hypothetical protein